MMDTIKEMDVCCNGVLIVGSPLLTCCLELQDPGCHCLPRGLVRWTSAAMQVVSSFGSSILRACMMFAYSRYNRISGRRDAYDPCISRHRAARFFFLVASRAAVTTGDVSFCCL